ncbi:MAG: hypothetical protein AAB706_00605 [Patescibacteria group bacterium]
MTHHMNIPNAIKVLQEAGYKIDEPEEKTKIINNVEYELEQHDNNKKLSDIKIPKGWRLLKPFEAQRLWDLGYLRDNWIFVENPLKNEFVARFGAGSGRANLDCGGDPSFASPGFGVIFCRDLKVKK